MTDDPSRSMYTGDRGRQYHRSKRSIPIRAFDWVARIRAEKIQRYVRPEDVVYEFGVGFGWNLAQLRCRRKIGYDLGEFLAEGVREHGIEFVPAEKLEDGSIDVVICHHVLEHVAEPLELLSEAKRLLRPAGNLLTYVPFEKERRYRRFNPSEPNHHLYSWNVQTLGNLLQMAGFELQSGCVAMFSYDRFCSVLSDRLSLGERGYRLFRWIVQGIYPCLEVRTISRKPSSSA